MSGDDGEDHVRIFDTTLRDGEQSPGCTMTLPEKLRIARQLERLGVDVIEAGFPVASLGEAESVRQIAAAVTRPIVAGLCRTREGDIRAAYQALKDATHPRLHVFIATSEIHMTHKLRMTPDQVLEQVRRGVSLCRSLCADVEFSAEDASRTDLDFLCEVMRLAVECGATTVNIPDTVGYTTPLEYDRMVRAVQRAIGPDPIISTHCHDDLGLAVANSLAAVRAGARQIECCVNGIGERAGNASLEEVVMALRTRRDVFGVDTRIDTRQLVATSRLVSDVTGMVVPPNKAIVGVNAFAHESGIHQHGVLSERTTYEIMAPQDVGFATSNLVLGKHSGRHALRSRLSELGYEVDDEHLKRLFVAFKALADKKKDIHDADLRELVGQADRGPAAVEVVQIQVTSGDRVAPKVEARVRVGDQLSACSGSGDGPVDAAVDAIRCCVGVPHAVLEHYELRAVTEGADALGRATVVVRLGDEVVRGRGTHTDVVVASARAFADALSSSKIVREKVMNQRMRATG